MGCCNGNYVHVILSVAALISIVQTPVLASQKSYVVYMGSHSHGLNPTAEQAEIATHSHHSLLGSVLGSTEKAQEAIIYSYNKYINGFAAMLTEGEADRIKNFPNVVSVFEDKGIKLHTTRSWEFLGLEKNGVPNSNSLWKKAKYGQDTIIANLDTGVWPESQSFNDKGLGPVPSRWKGACEDKSPNKVKCNKKLIGAKYFNQGFAAAIGQKLNSSYQSARDIEGHGTHTLSTAGGRFVAGARILNNEYGTVKGGSPNARVATYKVCWPPVNDSVCFPSDIMAGFEAAIADSVDVLSVSLGAGGGFDYITDSLAIGAFHAVQHGITVVASAGNSGPFESTVTNVAPWILTVGASTMDRQFTNWVSFGGKDYKGKSLGDKLLPKKDFYPVINSTSAKLESATDEAATFCMPDSLDSSKVKGKIVVCLTGTNSRVEEGLVVHKAGGVGFILVNQYEDEDFLFDDLHFLPASHITYVDGHKLSRFVQESKNPTAYISGTKTFVGSVPGTDPGFQNSLEFYYLLRLKFKKDRFYYYSVKKKLQKLLGLQPKLPLCCIRPCSVRAPIVAEFSSLGPNTVNPEIIKPDIIAPGVSIIAAYGESGSPTDISNDTRRVKFNAMSGTSMSTPHISGIVGLLKTLHPDWSHAAIRSAIMTTASTTDNTNKPISNQFGETATPLEYGSGHVRPNEAADPGLVYDIAVDDYLNFLCAKGYSEKNLTAFAGKPYKCPKSASLLNLNYPSIAVPRLKGSVKITREVKNVGKPATYKANVTAPAGVSVAVEPNTLKFTKAGEVKKFNVSLTATGHLYPGKYLFGSLVWSDGKHIVRSTIAVVGA